MNKINCGSILYTIAALSYIAFYPTLSLHADNKEKTNIKEPTIKIGLEFDAQYGFVNENSFFANVDEAMRFFKFDDRNAFDKALGKKYNSQLWKGKQGIASNNLLKFHISAQSNDIKYGGILELNTNTSKLDKGYGDNPAKSVSVYAQGDFGKFVAGSCDGASTVLRVSGATVAKATGGIDGDADNWMTYRIVGSPEIDKNNNKDNIHILNNSLFITGPSLVHGNSYSKANKITYYTPSINGLTFGLSYVPKSYASGSTFKLNESYKQDFSDVFELGGRYEVNAKDNIKIVASIIGEFGHSDNIVAGASNQSLKRRSLSTWELGTSVEYKGIALAGSYGFWGKSGAFDEIKTEGSSNYWTLGAAYTYDKFGASITYLGSNARHIIDKYGYNFVEALGNTYNPENNRNEFNKVSVGVEYSLMPGLVPYAEVTFFNYKTKMPKLKLNNGSVILTGLKIKF